MVGPSCKGVVDLEAPVSHNLNVIAKVLDRRVEDLVIIILDRPRHEKLIGEIRNAQPLPCRIGPLKVGIRPLRVLAHQLHVAVARFGHLLQPLLKRQILEHRPQHHR